MLTLTNDFHHTEVRLRVTGNQLSPNQVRRARRILCGISDCSCGGVAGERGPQFRGAERVYMQAAADGSAFIELA